jgi:hypothetical protein
MRRIIDTFRLRSHEHPFAGVRIEQEISIMNNATKVTLVAATAIGIATAANAAVSKEPAQAAPLSTAIEGTGLLPRDLVVDALGMIRKSVKPSTPPIRLACDSGCPGNKC